MDVALPGWRSGRSDRPANAGTTDHGLSLAIIDDEDSQAASYGLRTRAINSCDPRTLFRRLDQQTGGRIGRTPSCEQGRCPWMPMSTCCSAPWKVSGQRVHEERGTLRESSATAPPDRHGFRLSRMALRIFAGSGWANCKHRHSCGHRSCSKSSDIQARYTVMQQMMIDITASRSRNSSRHPC